MKPQKDRVGRKTKHAQTRFTFRYIHVEGAVRRVRFALAWRTEPVLTILSQNSLVASALLSALFALSTQGSAGDPEGRPTIHNRVCSLFRQCRDEPEVGAGHYCDLSAPGLVTRQTHLYGVLAGRKSH